MKKTASNLLLLLFLAFFVAGIFFIYQGFDRKDNYYHSDYSWGKNENVYVGGDAYNYIINGTYFAGYCALGGSFLICGSVTGVGSILCRAAVRTDKPLTGIPTSTGTAATKTHRTKERL